MNQAASLHNWSFWRRFKAVPKFQKFRYAMITLSCLAFLGPLAILPGLVGNNDLCGVLCMRRFYLYFPGMSMDDLWMHMSVAWIGTIFFFMILTVTFFYGRIWCGFICPVGGLSELVSRVLGPRWKIDYRPLPQVPIRYGYLATYILLMPMVGISACTLCNFITVPRLVTALTGGTAGVAFIFSTIGLANLSLLLMLGFFAEKGRAYCQFMCPIGAIDGLVNRAGAKLQMTHRIRVERSRCTGCNECAKACMTGSIKIVNGIAQVDQTSCMSCHDCVDHCEWNAIEWTAGPRNVQPKRIKKNIQIYPEPQWQAFPPAPMPAADPVRGVMVRQTLHYFTITAMLMFVLYATIQQL